MSERTRQADLHRLAALDVGRTTFAAPLAAHGTWHIGGPADLLIEPENIAQIQAVVYFARTRAIPLLVIGQGSNLLFADSGLRGIVLKLGNSFANIAVCGDTITAEAGAWVPGVARRAQQAGLAGLEHTIGIPGTLGGLVVMNGGSQRQGIGDHVRRIWTVGAKGKLTELTKEECRFGYRSSALQESGAVVVKVELVCPLGDPRAIRHAMLADLRERRRKFPRKEPNCGSVFLSTAAMHASVGPPGKIIEEAGLKGTRCGGAEVSHRHANFIVNTGGATAADVLALIDRVRHTVHQHIGFTLACEVRYVDEQAAIRPADQLLPPLV